PSTCPTDSPGTRSQRTSTAHRAPLFDVSTRLNATSTAMTSTATVRTRMTDAVRRTPVVTSQVRAEAHVEPGRAVLAVEGPGDVEPYRTQRRQPAQPDAGADVKVHAFPAEERIARIHERRR